MKKIVLLSTLFAFLFVTSCKDDKKETPSTVTPIEVTQQQNAILELTVYLLLLLQLRLLQKKQLQ
jgi:hypothetical protein